MERAVIYNRCSTEEEAQINALEVQAQESREIVLRQGWQLIEQYIESQSGTTTGKRTEYQRLLADMETDRFDIVVIKSIDRLMRSAKDWYCFVDRLTRNRKRLYIYIDHKFYTPDDSLLTGIKAILAEDFSRELSKKIKNAHKRRQDKQTGYNITVPIFGWNKVEKDVYEINEQEAEAYRLAFALAEEGKGFYTIANQMYARGVRGKNGNRISDVQWRNMLYSPKAHGTVVLHTAEYDFESKKKIQLPPDEWIYVDNALPAIVSKEYQKMVLEVLAFRKKRDNSKISDSTGTAAEKKLHANGRMIKKYALSGKLYCGICGAVYYRTVVHGKKGGRVVWKCSTALKHGRKTAKRQDGCNNISVAEETIFKFIEDKIYNELPLNLREGIEEEFISFLRRGICQNNDKNEKKRLEKEFRKIEKKKNVLLEKLLNGVIGDIDFKNLYQSISENMDEIQNRINNIIEVEKEYNDYDKRLSKIKEMLKDGVIAKAETMQLITRINKIIVYEDKGLELHFDEFCM